MARKTNFESEVMTKEQYESSVLSSDGPPKRRKSNFQIETEKKTGPIRGRVSNAQLEAAKP